MKTILVILFFLAVTTSVVFAYGDIVYSARYYLPPGSKGKVAFICIASIRMARENDRSQLEIRMMNSRCGRRMASSFAPHLGAISLLMNDGNIRSRT